MRSLFDRRFLPSSGSLHQQNSHRGVVGWISVTDCLLLGLVVLLAVSLSLQSKKRATEAALVESKASLEVAEMHLDEQVEKYDEDMNEAAKNQEVLEDRNDILSNGFDDLSDENFALKERLEKSKDEAGELAGQLDGKKTNERELRNKISKAEDKINSLSQGNDGLSKEKFSLEQKLGMAGRELAKAESEVKELKKKIAGKYEIDKEIKNLKSENEWLVISKEKLESDKEKLESDKEKLESDKEKLESDKEKIANQLEMESKRHASINLSLSVESRGLQAELMTSKSDYTKLQKELDDYEKKQLKAKDREILLRRELVGFKGDLQRVAFVIDHSGSMKNRWENAKSTIMNWITALEIKECVVFTFSEPGKPAKYPKPFESKSIFQLSGEEREQSIDQIRQMLQATKPEGRTDTYDALKFVYQFPDIDTIVLFTDGAPYLGKSYKFKGQDKTNLKKNADSFLIQETQKLCEQNKHIPVNVVGVGNFYEPTFAGFLLQLAKISDGTFLGRGD